MGATMRVAVEQIIVLGGVKCSAEFSLVAMEHRDTFAGKSQFQSAFGPRQTQGFDLRSPVLIDVIGIAPDKPRPAAGQFLNDFHIAHIAAVNGPLCPGGIEQLQRGSHRLHMPVTV
jgi:hypothetical protein